MTKPILAKFELEPNVVLYLRNAVNSQSIQGAEQAQALLTVIHLLNNPLNKEELLKAQPPVKPKKDE